MSCLERPFKNQKLDFHISFSLLQLQEIFQSSDSPKFEILMIVSSLQKLVESSLDDEFEHLLFWEVYKMASNPSHEF